MAVDPTKLRGVFPVFQTPFFADESIDFDSLQREVEWIAGQGVSGVVFGMVSEALRLSDPERKAVIAAASDAAKAFDLPCIASVGAESTSAALGRIDDAVEGGAAALMATPPLCGSHNEQQLEEYFGALLAYSPVPLIVQDASGYVGQELSIGLQSRLFEEFGQKVGFKPEAVPIAPALEALLAATDRQAHVFEGMGGAALRETYPGGVVGSMPGAEVCWAVVALWNALESGAEDRAQAISSPLVQMIDLQDDLDSFVVCEKYLLVAQSVLGDATARRPVSFELTTDKRSTLDRLLDELHRAVFDTPH